jgi:putative membrane protein
MLLAFDFRVLAHVDAALNAVATVLIVLGLLAVKLGRVELHKKLMLAAAGVSALFLVSYLTYHFNTEAVKYTGEGLSRTVYFVLLITHIVLAAVQVPLILRTIWLGLKDRQEAHRKWARITAPIWLYVSITGVVIYVMLYHG